MKNLIARVWVGNDYAEWVFDDVDMEEFKGMSEDDIRAEIVDRIYDNISVEFYEEDTFEC